MIGERIKQVRKALGLTQTRFGEIIGLKQNSVALIEAGRETSDQTIFAICREFRVNEEWLRTGCLLVVAANQDSRVIENNLVQ